MPIKCSIWEVHRFTRAREPINKDVGDKEIMKWTNKMIDHLLGGFPGFEKLFELSDPVANRPFRGEYGAPDNGAGVSRGESEVLATVPIHWAMGGGVPSGVIWTTSAHPLIVHGRVIDLFRANGFTGWSTYDVEVHAKDERVIPDYYGLTITGRCARQDLSRSSIHLVQMPGGWVPRFHGFYFDPATWDGSDLFMEAPDQLGKVSMRRCVTERVWRVLRQAKVGNLLFQRLPDVSISTSNYDGLRHLLPADFKDRLATAYAKAGVPRPKWVK